MNNKEKFERYAEMLREWSTRINLVAQSTLDDIESRHIADSIQLADYLSDGVQVIDLGSGAGFPGVVLAVLGWDVICIESVGKKTGFLNELKKELDLPNLTIVNDRIEYYLGPKAKCKVPEGKEIIFTARAFASLDKILGITKNFKKAGKKRFLLLKGRGAAGEIRDAKLHHKFDYKLYPSKTGDGNIIEIISD